MLFTEHSQNKTPNGGRNMKKQIAMGLIAVSLASGSVYAEEKKLNSPENIGFGSGLVAGAAIGGPAGAMIGALGGILMGNSITVDKQMTALKQDLNESKQAYARLESERNRLQQQNIQLASSVRESQLDLAMNVQFRTGSAQLEPLYRETIETTIELLKKDANLQVTLSGYADRRGDEQFNEQLSVERVAAVKALFKQAGINLNRIKTREFGERNPTDSVATMDGDAFDRRVTIEVSGPTSMVVNR
jgi:sortase system peptidoglycan-associated protein